MNISKFFDDNKSELCFGAGIFFSLASTYLAAKNAPKAKEKLDALKAEKGKLTPWDYVKTCWKDMLPAFGSTVASLVFLGESKKLDGEKIVATTAAYEMANKFIAKYSENVEKQIGEAKNEEAKKQAVSEMTPKVVDAPQSQASEDKGFYDGDTYFLDLYFNKPMITNSIKLKSAVNALNATLNTSDYACINDFYEEICRQTPCKVNQDLISEAGDYLGFNIQKGLLGIELENGHEINVNEKRIAVFGIRYICEESGRTRLPVMFYESGE